MLILKGHKKPIYEIDFSPDGMKLISGGGDGTARLWDLLLGKQIGCVKVADWVTSVAFAPDGRTAIVGGPNCKTLCWDVQQDKIIQEMDFSEVNNRAGPGQVRSLSFSRTGKRLVASSDRGLACWKLQDHSWDLLWHHQEWGGCVTCSSDEKTVVTGSAIDSEANIANCLDLWELETGEHRKSIPERGPYWTCRTSSVSYSPDGSMIAATCGRELVVWDSETLAERFSFSTKGKFFQSVAFSPDSRCAAAVNNDMVVQTWDTVSWKAGNILAWEIGRLLDIAFAPDGMRAAACSSTGKIIIWDLC
jgi:WD40 repeat protein